MVQSLLENIKVVAHIFPSKFQFHEPKFKWIISGGIIWFLLAGQVKTWTTLDKHYMYINYNTSILWHFCLHNPTTTSDAPNCIRLCPTFTAHSDPWLIKCFFFQLDNYNVYGPKLTRFLFCFCFLLLSFWMYSNFKVVNRV